MDWFPQTPGFAKRVHALMVNGAPASRTQLALGELLGWTVNLRVDRYALDLADAKTKVYIELDGTGHDLPVQLGTMTRRVHKVRQSRRDRSLLAAGWRLIRVVSHDDRLPANDVLRGLLNLCTAYLGLGRHWVTVDLDRGLVVGSHLRMQLDGEGRVVG